MIIDLINGLFFFFWVLPLHIGRSNIYTWYFIKYSVVSCCPSTALTVPSDRRVELALTRRRNNSPDALLTSVINHQLSSSWKYDKNIFIFLCISVTGSQTFAVKQCVFPRTPFQLRVLWTIIVDRNRSWNKQSKKREKVTCDRKSTASARVKNQQWRKKN